MHRKWNVFSAETMSLKNTIYMALLIVFILVINGPTSNIKCMRIILLFPQYPIRHYHRQLSKEETKVTKVE